MKPNYFLLSVFVLILISCDSETEILYPDPFHPDQEQFKSSIFVEVVNTSGQPVTNATVRIGSYKQETDLHGFVYLKDVLVGASTYLVAEKANYFHASRRFYPTKGGHQYIKLIMMTNSMVGAFSSRSGATLSIDGGITLHFPKDGYEYNNGSSYDGEVEVAAKAIPADDPDLSYKMPGDLTGVDANGQQGSLASLGMVAVELQTSNGSPLRLKKGVKVQIDMTVPSTNLDVAPSTIPMWHFDENDGLWKQEGSAILSGNIYTANVSHFSYWNFDAWFPAVKWGATFDFGNRGLAGQLEVCITIISMNTTKCASTNELGMVCGLVAANELLLMEVTNVCGEVIYSAEIGPFSDSTMMSPITLSNPGGVITSVSGHAVGCDGNPVTDGFAQISIGKLNQYVSLDEVTGAFNASIPTCEENDIHISLVDLKNNKLKAPISFAYAPTIDADTIIVCEANQEYIELEVGGIPDHYFFYNPSSMEFDSFRTSIYADNGFSQGSQISFTFVGTDTGLHEIYLGALAIYLPGYGWFSSAENLVLNITHYGEVGDFITGNLSGKWVKENPGSGAYQEFSLKGSFSVKRE